MVHSHEYVPEYSAMGDCKICGHIAESSIHVNRKTAQIIIDWKDEGQGYLATVPVMPGCNAFGLTRAQAAENIEIAMTAYLQAAASGIDNDEEFYVVEHRESDTRSVFALWPGDGQGGLRQWVSSVSHATRWSKAEAIQFASMARRAMHMRARVVRLSDALKGAKTDAKDK